MAREQIEQQVVGSWDTAGKAGGGNGCRTAGKAQQILEEMLMHRKKLKVLCRSGFLHHPRLADGAHDKHQYIPFPEILGLFYSRTKLFLEVFMSKVGQGPE